MVIGDFDSIDFDSVQGELSDFNVGAGGSVVRVAAEKDDTDTMICLKYGMEKGFDDFYILGGLGGRLDHTIANLQTLSFALDHDKSVWILDGKNRATLRNPGSIVIKKLQGHYISLFSYGESCGGVTIKGVKYPLENHLLTNSFPLGVSNDLMMKLQKSVTPPAKFSSFCLRTEIYCDIFSQK
jgi:thiamine pyrophosphokinase